MYVHGIPRCYFCKAVRGANHSETCLYARQQRRRSNTEDMNYMDDMKDIELEARDIVRGGDRETSYGHPRNDLERTAKIWSGILGTDVTPEQVALCMIGLKMSRLVNTPHHHDSKVDIVGYTICYDRLNEK